MVLPNEPKNRFRALAWFAVPKGVGVRKTRIAVHYWSVSGVKLNSANKRNGFQMTRRIKA